MVCKKCGQIVPINGRFCPNCGAPLNGSDRQNTGQNQQTQKQSVYNQPSQNRQNYSQPVQNQETYSQPMQGQPAYSQPAAPNAVQLTMKWYKFLIYFALFAGALGNLGMVGYYGGGTQYTQQGVEPSLVYAYYGNGLKMADLAMGGVSLILAVLCIVIRQQLKKFKNGAWKNYIYLVAAGLVSTVIYQFVTASIAGADMAYALGRVAAIGVVEGIFIFLNWKYFKKREYLFVN